MKLKIPNTYVLLFVIVIIFGAASFFIPSGTFDRITDSDTGITYVVYDSFRYIDKENISLFDFIKAIPDGMMQASDIIMFVLITGGSFGIINSTGTINTLVSRIVKLYGKNGKRVIPIVMIVFSLAGAVFGTAEEALPLYPIFIALALALGFDRITGVSMVLLGTGAGFVAGFLNPFTVGIAQEVSELPLFSGIEIRLLAYVIFVSTAIIYVYVHASKVENRDVDTVNLYGENQTYGYDFNNLPEFTDRHKRVVMVVVASIIFLIIGIAKWQFYILEISTTFLIMGIASGVVSGLHSGRIVSEFIKGASSLMYGALIIGMARSIMVIMEYSQIMDTVIYKLSLLVKGFAPAVSSIIMFFVQSLINIFITSGSGQAAVTMPIMKNLADISGVPRQTAVLAFQFGDGFSNVISPTSGYFMAALGLASIKWRDWLNYMLPLFIIWCIEGCILLIISIKIFIN